MATSMDEGTGGDQEATTGLAMHTSDTPAVLTVVRVKFEHAFLNERRTVLMKRPLTLDGVRQTVASTFGQEMPLYYQTHARGMLLLRSQADLDEAQMDINLAAPLPCLRLLVSHEPSPGAVNHHPGGGHLGFTSSGSQHSLPGDTVDPFEQPAGAAPVSMEVHEPYREPNVSAAPTSVRPGPAPGPSVMSPTQRPAPLSSGPVRQPVGIPTPIQSATGQERPWDVPGGGPGGSAVSNTRVHAVAHVPSTWRIGRKLGVGGFGHVYLCHDQDTGNQFALKQVIFDETGVEMQKEVKALEAEIDLLKKIQHERVVAYIGVHKTATTLSILMEYMPGGSIHSYVKENGPLTETLTRKYTFQILEGLAYLHSERIIHRDVKGANVLRDSNGNVKLADFGASRQLHSIRSKMTNKSIQGTPYWMSPEVINGSGYDERADMWSLGCTMVEMLTTRPPWFDFEPMQALFKIGHGKEGGPTIPSTVSLLCQHFLKRLFTFDYKHRPVATDMMNHDFFAA